MALNSLSHILCPATIITIFIHSVNIIIYHSISGRSREFSVKIAVAYNKTSVFMHGPCKFSHYYKTLIFYHMTNVVGGEGDVSSWNQLRHENSSLTSIPCILKVVLADRREQMYVETAF